MMVSRRETLDRLSASTLFSDLGKILDDVIRPINRALHTYSRVNSSALRAIEPEIAFYVGAAFMIQNAAIVWFATVQALFAAAGGTSAASDGGV